MNTGKIIATWILCETMKNSTSGNYVVETTEINEFLGFSASSDDLRNAVECLESDDAVLDVEFYNGFIDVIVGTSFCLNFQGDDFCFD